MQPVSGYLDDINWNINVYPKPVELNELTKSVLLPMSSIAVLLNILFILVQYYLLKRKTQLERAQNEAQKLELIGTLAASTAHEIRNPLTGISGFIQLLQKNTNRRKISCISQLLSRRLSGSIRLSVSFSAWKTDC